MDAWTQPTKGTHCSFFLVCFIEPINSNTSTSIRGIRLSADCLARPNHSRELEIAPCSCLPNIFPATTFLSTLISTTLHRGSRLYEHRLFDAFQTCVSVRFFHCRELCLVLPLLLPLMLSSFL